MTVMDKTLEDFIGNTPLVRLQRLPGKTSNVLLAKLEGNNPAGSVKDRPALSMIKRARQRGDIKPGDTTVKSPAVHTTTAPFVLRSARSIHGARPGLPSISTRGCSGA